MSKQAPARPSPAQSPEQRAQIEEDLRAFQAYISLLPEPPGSVAQCLAFALAVQPRRGTCWVQADPFRALLATLPERPTPQDLERAITIGYALFQFLYRRGRVSQREMTFALQWLPAAADALHDCLELGLSPDQIRTLEPELRDGKRD